MAPMKLLIINPNSSVSITTTLEPLLRNLASPDTTLTFWTSPTSPSILRSQSDITASVVHSLPPLLALAHDYDGFLLACYAAHPLVALLQSYVAPRPVVGIFEASITTALHLLSPSSRFAILTTGKAYEPLLTEGLKRYLGTGKDGSRFAGVVASGVGLDDLKGDPAVLKRKVVEATRKAVAMENVGVICLGGVILVGMEEWVMEACIRELGEEIGGGVRIVDQLQAGMKILQGLVDVELN